MYAAATSGTLEVVCATIQTPNLNWACEQVAQYAQEVFAGLGEPENDECLRVEAKIGWPILPSYVKVLTGNQVVAGPAPPGRPDHLGGASAPRRTVSVLTRFGRSATRSGSGLPAPWWPDLVPAGVKTGKADHRHERR